MSTLLCCIAAIGLHVASHHSKPGFNNFNPGIYVETTDGYTAGTYDNSESHQSYYAGRTFEAQVLPHASVAVTVGAITGYRAAPVLPLVVPTLRIPLADKVSTRFAFIPRVEKKGAAAVHLMLEYRV
jgi:hypothetical protein